MGYLHIDNLYKDDKVLLFKEVYALEKIHGTSTHVSFNEGVLHFFSGGCSHEEFLKLFDYQALLERFQEKFGDKHVTVFGEGYGGKMQGMSATYGKSLRFIVFDVKIDEYWLSVPQAEDVATYLGFQFVHYVKVPATLEALDGERDAYSVQAVRNGMGDNLHREGIVIRPLIEVKTNNGERIIAKHKGEKFQETSKKIEVGDKTKLTEAKEIALMWVTRMRLEHILNGAEAHTTDLGRIIPAMIADIERESEGFADITREVKVAIGAETAKLVKQVEREQLYKE